MTVPRPLLVHTPCRNQDGGCPRIPKHCAQCSHPWPCPAVAGLYPSVTPADLLAEGDPDAPRPVGPDRRGSIKGRVIPRRETAGTSDYPPSASNGENAGYRNPAGGHDE